MVELQAGDGHTFGAYRAQPDGDIRAGLVVIQEIFGVNSHIRNVADRFAAAGFDALAPALFDRAERGLELGYQPDDIDRGRAVRGQLSNDQALLDVDAAIGFLAQTGRPVAVVGYCWGGSLAWAAATRLQGLAGAVCYYGGEIAKMADELPLCPVMLHFGETDHAIPMEDVETVRAKHPTLPLFTYPAGHGFSCDERGSFHALSAELALNRTVEFLNTHTGGG
ncbi:MAG: dienelactone hydrolase family protein [Proteobacteria bacterium]|nr:dienelactone hydrolase family protein [Pseudomonadota bacterium]